MNKINNSEKVCSIQQYLSHTGLHSDTIINTTIHALSLLILIVYALSFFDLLIFSLLSFSDYQRYLAVRMVSLSFMCLIHNHTLDDLRCTCSSTQVIGHHLGCKEVYSLLLPSTLSLSRVHAACRHENMQIRSVPLGSGRSKIMKKTQFCLV